MIVQAAMTLLVFLGLSAFVVDYGVLWVSRAQAQNAADGGAVAGAVARAYDDSATPPSATLGIVADSIRHVVTENPVWLAAVPSFVVTFGCPVGAGYHCVKVDVHRDEEFGNALPMFFGQVFGITSQEVRATATAQVAAGNGTNCLKPWAIPDKWVENLPPANVFEKYMEIGPGAGMELTPPHDDYVPPDEVGAGSGFLFPKDDAVPPVDDLGLPITLSFPQPEDTDPITQGFLLPLVLPGANDYEQNIAGCNGHLVTVGQEIETRTVAATDADFAALLASDPGAMWDPFTRNVQGSCAPGCGPVSPRLVALAVFDPSEYQRMRANNDWCDGGAAPRCVKVVNIMGFFIELVNPGAVVGRIARYPGLLSPGGSLLFKDSSFLPAITLVR